MALALGRSINRRVFFTTTAVHTSQQRGARQHAGLGDPLLSVRWTLIPLSLAATEQPQLQFIAGARPAWARSIHQSSDPDLLDVHGTGFPETRLGFDLWFGMLPYKVGLASIWSASPAKVYGGAKIRPGLGNRSTLSVGHALPWAMKALLGVNHDARGELSHAARTVPGSEQRSLSGFLTLDRLVRATGTLRATLAQQGLRGYGNRNTTRATNFSVAYMQAF